MIGQHRILSQLEDIAWAIKLREIDSANVLLRSPPGYGKTSIAKYIAKIVDDLYSYQQIKKGKTTIFDNVTIRIRVQIVDEIHLDLDVENLYMKMDSGRYFFIFCTTDAGDLPDAFVSRCMVYTLDDYSVDELAQMVYAESLELNLNIDRASAEFIASVSRGVPRNAISLTKRIKIALTNGRFENNLDGIISAAEYIGVTRGGFTELDHRYLSLLRENSPLGLNNLCRILSVDRDTVVNTIEPFLISKGLISITSKGRLYNGSL